MIADDEQLGVHASLASFTPSTSAISPLTATRRCGGGTTGSAR